MNNCIIKYSAREGAELRIRDGFFSFFSCRDLVIIDFLGNLRRAIKLVLNSPTRLSTVVSVDLLCMHTKVDSGKKIILTVHREVEFGS